MLGIIQLSCSWSLHRNETTEFWKLLNNNQLGWNKGCMKKYNWWKSLIFLPYKENPLSEILPDSAYFP